MLNLFDLTRQAQSGAGLEVLSRQFGLSAAQFQLALDALLPAFSLAFRRNAQDPGAFAGLLGLMTSGRYGPFFDGRPPARGGEDLLEALFGSREVARRVADQAAAMTGIGGQVMQAIMPVLAGTLVGGMFRYATVEGFADLLRQWSDALKHAVSPRPPPRPAAADPWSAWFDLMSTAMGPRPTPPAPPPAPPPGNPFEAWAQVMSSMMGGEGAKPAPPPPAREPNPFEAISRLFEAGREIQTQNLAAFSAILDAGAGRPRTS